MLESIAPIIALIALGSLMLWGAAQIAPFPMHNTKSSRRKKLDKIVTELPVDLSRLAFQPKPKQPMKVRRKVRRFDPFLVGGPFSIPAGAPEELTEDIPEATPARPEPEHECESPPQEPKMRNFRGMDLRGVRLCGEDLAGADLSYCNLVRANLQDSDLSYTRFGPTKRPWAEVYSLRGVSPFPWRMVELVGANIGGVGLQRADCTGSDILCGKHDPAYYWTQW